MDSLIDMVASLVVIQRGAGRTRDTRGRRSQVDLALFWKNLPLPYSKKFLAPFEMPQRIEKHVMHALSPELDIFPPEKCRSGEIIPVNVSKEDRTPEAESRGSASRRLGERRALSAPQEWHD